MTSRLNPYLNFPGTARAALQFYRDVFGGELTTTTFSEFHAASTAEDHDKIMHGTLRTAAGYTIMASDLPAGQEHEPGTNIAMSLSSDEADGEALRGYWQRLAEDGMVVMPMEKQVWGDEFGMCVDRFGIHWMVDIGHDQT